MKPIQIVIDTNVFVAAARSDRGASFALLNRLSDKRFEINVSQALVLEYEEKLKQLMAAKGPEALVLVDRFLDYIISIANVRSVNMSLLAEGVNEGDQFIVDLAIASKAAFIVTYNKRHFTGVWKYGLKVKNPFEFLGFLENMP